MRALLQVRGGCGRGWDDEAGWKVLVVEGVDEKRSMITQKYGMERGKLARDGARSLNGLAKWMYWVVRGTDARRADCQGRYVGVENLRERNCR